MWTSRKTDFRKLKINLVTMTYHSQRPQCPSLSPHVLLHTVKSHFKALGLYNLKRGFGWAYKRGGGGYKRNKKMFRNDEIKRI